MIDRSGIKVGVLALQGAHREHIALLKRCKIDAQEVKYPEQLRHIHGLIIPGGESTTIYKLLVKYGFRPFFDKFYKDKKPIFGTCAGMILLSKKVEGHAFGLGYIDIDVHRNAYGRQKESFEAYVDIDLNGLLNEKKFKAVFIRAPRIMKAAQSVKILSRIGQDIICARQQNILVSSFHPELADDLRIHEYFINMIIKTF